MAPLTVAAARVVRCSITTAVQAWSPREQLWMELEGPLMESAIPEHPVVLLHWHTPSEK